MSGILELEVASGCFIPASKPCVSSAVHSTLSSFGSGYSLLDFQVI